MITTYKHSQENASITSQSEHSFMGFLSVFWKQALLPLPVKTAAPAAWDHVPGSLPAPFLGTRGSR